MTKFNYNEPEFKVVVTGTEDVITTSPIVQPEGYDSIRIDGGIVPFNL